MKVYDSVNGLVHNMFKKQMFVNHFKRFHKVWFHEEWQIWEYLLLRQTPDDLDNFKFDKVSKLVIKIFIN